MPSEQAQQTEQGYTIQTDRWHQGKRMETWTPFGEVWETDSKADAIRHLAYFRFAYPGYSFALIDSDGYIVSTKELSEMARYLIA